MSSEPQAAPSSPDGTVIDTIQSLIVAFVLAMTFRGFVIEGFVIPTGSMAPTLMGQHVLLHSDQTGSTFQVGLDQSRLDGSEQARLDLAERVRGFPDPMLGPMFPGSASVRGEIRPRMGDRILVLKCLYPFSEPKRFDVVVFKNPTDPVGEAANYIKRLIGLPDEHIWLADGDVFAKGPDSARFEIQRKPEHVQRAVWQMVHHSDYVPQNPERFNWKGPPWVGEGWDLTGRAYRFESAEPTALHWDSQRRPLNDWTPYNLVVGKPPMNVSDLRISAAIVADQPGLTTGLQIDARSHQFEFVIDSARAILRMRPDDNGGEWVVREAAIELPAPGTVFNVEFWHVDQALRLFIDGAEVIEPLFYDLEPVARLQTATGNLAVADVDALVRTRALPPAVRWLFSGAPVTLHRVRMDRDLHYRFDILNGQKNAPVLNGVAFGLHPEDNKAQLQADQFMMLGDNSQMSLDSRLWGSPHPLIAAQIDPSPFIVNRKLLLGKAWVVYFPAPYAFGDWQVIPDFGRLRFIR